MLDKLIIACLSIGYGIILFYSDPELLQIDIDSDRLISYRIVPWIGLSVSILSLLKKISFRFNSTDISLFLFCIYLLLTEKSIPDSVIALFLTISYYFFFRFFLQSNSRTTSFLSAFLLIFGIGEVILGFCQQYGFTTPHHKLYSLTGTFYNPGPYSGFLAVLSPIALYWVLEKRNTIAFLSRRRLKAIWQMPKELGHFCLFFLSLFLLAGTLLILPLGMSRSAWFAASIGCFIVLEHRFSLFTKGKKYFSTYPKRTLFYSLFSLCIIIGLGIGFYYLKKDSANGRLLMWKISSLCLDSWKGVGTGHFPEIFGKTQAAYFASGKASPSEEMLAGSPEYAFNEYLQIGIEQGIIGLLLFLAVIVSAIHRASRSGLKGSNATIGALVAFLIFGCFSYPFRVVPLCFLFFILLAQTGSKPTQSRFSSFRSWMIRGFTILLTGITFGLTEDRHSKRDAYIRWAEEKNYFNLNVFEETVDHYGELYPFLNQEAHFLFEYGQCLSKIGQYETSNRILQEGIRYSSDPMFYNIMGKNYQALKQYEKAEKAFRQAHFMIPHRFYPLYLMAKMYFESGQVEKGKDMARQLLGKKTKIHSTAIDEMRNEMQFLLQDSLK